MQFQCVTCGKSHDIDEISFGAPEPASWKNLTSDEKQNSQLSEEQCIIRAHGKIHYFIRACLEVPIQGTEKKFVWGVWASLSERSYVEILKNWDNPNRSNMGPYFGYLCTPIPEYPDTMFLKSMIHNRKTGERPWVELEKTDHILSVHQREGVTQDWLQKIVSKLLHSAG